MRKFGLPLCILLVFLLGIKVVKGGDPKKTTVPAAPVKDAKAEKRKADSLSYVNFSVDSKDHTFQDTPNEILLNNGMKITFVKLNRFPIPRGVSVTIPDDIAQRFKYELAEVEMKATNTNSYEVKLNQTPSEALLVSFKMYGAETGGKAFTSQYSLSYGSVYSMTEPKQTEKLTPIFKETTAFVSNNYKPGETKTCKGFIICLEKSAKTIDKIILQNQEFGTNKTYACPAKL